MPTVFTSYVIVFGYFLVIRGNNTGFVVLCSNEIFNGERVLQCKIRFLEPVTILLPNIEQNMKLPEPKRQMHSRSWHRIKWL